MKTAFEHEAVLSKTLQLIGSGQHLWMASAGRQWRSLQNQLYQNHDTTFASAFASESRLLAACDCGLRQILGYSTLLNQPLSYLQDVSQKPRDVELRDRRKIARAICLSFGKHGSLEVMKLALSLGLLELNSCVFEGVVSVSALDILEYIWPLIWFGIQKPVKL